MPKLRMKRGVCDPRLTRQPVVVRGLTTEGKLCPFSGTVQAIENGHTQYPDYPLRITMK